MNSVQYNSHIRIQNRACSAVFLGQQRIYGYQVSASKTLPSYPDGSRGRGSGKFIHTKSMNPGIVPSGFSSENRVQMSDVVDWFINLPWQKMASWMGVILLASQLRDFLGVRRDSVAQNQDGFVSLWLSA